MAKKTKKESPAVEIRKLLETKKLILGTERVVKQLKAGKIAKIFITSNCRDDVKKDILNYARIAKAEVVELDMPNDEFGVVCKKPFSISILGVAKD